MENNNNDPSDNLLTGDALYTQPSNLRGSTGHHYIYDETANINHNAASGKYHGEDTAPFNVTAFLNYLAAIDNCDDASADYYDSIYPASDFYDSTARHNDD